MWFFGVAAALSGTVVTMALAISLWVTGPTVLLTPWLDWATGLPVLPVSVVFGVSWCWILAVRRGQLLIGFLGSLAISVLALAVFFHFVMKTYRDVIDIIDFEGQTYGVMRTTAAMMPDTYVDIVRLDERGLVSDQISYMTTSKEIETAWNTSVVRRGESYHPSFDDDDGFIVETKDGRLVAGINGRVVAYDPSEASSDLPEKMLEKSEKRPP